MFQADANRVEMTESFLFLSANCFCSLMVDMIRAAPGSLIAIILSFHAFAAPSLIISNFAGNGTKGYSGDGGVATEAQLNFPTGISRGPDGALYICDTGNHRVRKVARDGIITTIAGT